MARAVLMIDNLIGYTDAGNTKDLCFGLIATSRDRPLLLCCYDTEYFEKPLHELVVSR